MISLQEFFNKSGYMPRRQFVYQKRWDEFRLSYPDKQVFTSNDIAEYCGGSKKLQDEMKIIEKFLRLNFRLITKPDTRTRKNLLLDAMVHEFLKYLKRKNYADRTIVSYSEELRVFQRYCAENGIRYIDDIDKNVLNAFKDRLYRRKHERGGYYDISVQSKLLQRTRSFFLFLVREEYILTNPCIHLTFPKERRKVSRNLFTRNEMDNFLSVIDTDNMYGFMDRTIFELLYSTGMRTGELLNLKLKDINFDDSIITIRNGKGGKDRVCFLTVIAKRYLEMYVHKIRRQYLVKNCKTDRVFPTRHGKKQETTNLSTRIKRWREIAGITYPVTIYAFRRSFATHLLQEGVNIRYIQQLMGHESISTTFRYISITLNDLHKILLKFHPREKALSDKKIEFKKA